MKSKILLVCLAYILCMQTKAQDSSLQAIKAAIDAKQFEFQPRTMTPMRGRVRQLDPGYFFKVSGDTVNVYLPYVGRAFSAPLDPSDAGFNFTTTQFEYTATEGKKKSYNVSIKTKNKTYNTDFAFTIYDDGTTYLRVNPTDRDAISYNGSIGEQ